MDGNPIDSRNTNIIKSNKMPAHLRPPTEKNNIVPTTVQSPELSPNMDSKNILMDSAAIPIQQNNKMTNSLSAIKLQSISINEPNVSNRFITAPVTPPLPTSCVVGSKANKLDISGPMNFKHIAGDMTRDRTRNAFDLTANSNDNVLKKYMIERRIKEQDINGMHKQDLIKKIVHSNFTWMPTNRITQTELPSIVYATISTNNQKTPPPLEANEEKPLFANYTSLTSKFIDLCDTPASEYLIKTDQLPIVNINKSFKQSLPAPQRLSKPTVAPPPPPSIITALSKTSLAQKEQTVNASNYDTIIYKSPIDEAHNNVPLFNIIEACEKSERREISESSPNQFLESKPSEILKGLTPCPPPLNSATATIPPPPPPPLPILTPSVNKISTVGPQKRPIYRDDSDWNAHLKNIRSGVMLKKVAEKSVAGSDVKPQMEKRPPPMDFLSELKLGINVRRAKNSSENIDDVNIDLNESHA